MASPPGKHFFVVCSCSLTKKQEIGSEDLIFDRTIRILTFAPGRTTVLASIVPYSRRRTVVQF